MSAGTRAFETLLSALRLPFGKDGLSDGQLLALARKRDETAIRALIRRYNQRLFRLARSMMKDEQEAEDVVQETYVRAFTALDSFRGDAAFSTWLTRIALNEANGRLRRRRTMVELTEIDRSEPAAGAEIIMFPLNSSALSPEAEAGRVQVRRLLEEAIDRLPEPFRVVFILREIEGMGTEETASLLSLKPETVKTRLFRAKRLLRAELEKALQPRFSDIFPFAGKRCALMADRVIARLRGSV